MANINETYESKYISAPDIKGREVTITIDRVEPAEMQDGTKKLCVYFRGAKKGLLLNKTNAMNIASLYGPETDNWIGQAITIGTSWVDFQGKSTEAIRVRPIQPRGNGPVDHQAPPQHAAQPPARQAEPNAYSQARPDLDDEIPF